MQTYTLLSQIDLYEVQDVHVRSVLQQHWLAWHRAVTGQPAPQQSSLWNHTWGGFKQNTPWNFFTFKFANRSKPVYYPKIIYFPVAPSEPTKEPWSPASIVGLAETWMAKVACQENCWRLQDPLELQPTWKSPIPSCRESEQLASFLSQNTIKKGKKYWKAYMCTEYCEFCRHLSFHQSEQQYLSHHYKWAVLWISSKCFTEWKASLS